jgi:uncharacterized protein YegL
MTNPNLTLVAFLVDRSGSMGGIREDMEGGINSLIESQKQEAGDTIISLAHFDTEYETLYQLVPVDDVEPFKLLPRGGTALNDSVGKFVTEIGEHLAKLSEDKRPGQVIVQIVTDGGENSSREWSTDQVKELLAQQTDGYNWVFSYMGSDITVEATAMSYGIASSNTIRYAREAVDTGMNASGLFLTRTRNGNTI